MIRSIFTIISISLLIACNTAKNQEDVASEIQLDLSTEIKTFAMPEGWGHFNHIFVNTIDKIYFYNYGKNSLVAFDKKTSELLFETKFEKEGPNGMGGNVADVKITDDGEIWLYTSGDRFFQMNASGEVLSQHTLKTAEIFEKNISPLGFALEKVDDVLYIPTIPMVFQWTSLTVDELAALPNVIAYNLKDDTYEFASMFDREFLGTNLNKMIMSGVTLGKNGELIVNLNFRDIYVMKDGVQHSYPASFSQFPADPPTSSKDMFEDMDEIMRIMNYSNAYERTAYLPLHNLYMRVARFEESPGDEMESRVTFLASKWALVFLDEDFQKVGEIILPESATNANYIFETEEGIWFSTDHPNNPDIDEDLFQFRLLTVK
ncbi:protein of unknown function [Belliella buryatensis]|uniref:DUF4221 domain-containing protein n=1 Tax=Belliella buryatensis TaxID=1500549 RepID=A0A239EZP9_9BACT|nr:DUF4221 family protein [Belliella buryatensis]SNS49382.1 protein of unknown function [Belliella buryatensis]